MVVVVKIDVIDACWEVEVWRGRVINGRRSGQEVYLYERVLNRSKPTALWRWTETRGWRGWSFDLDKR